MTAFLYSVLSVLSVLNNLMSFILTLVSSEKPLSAGHLALIGDNLAAMAVGAAGPPAWLAPHKAADLPLVQKPNHEQIRTLRILLEDDRVDLFINPAKGRQKKLLLADMDSTIIATETLDELAGQAGPEIQSRIAALTERAMRGEIDFEATLRARVAMIAGLPESALEKTRAAAAFSPGAKTLVKIMREHGALCVLVSGGFTFFTGWVAKECGFQHHRANRFEIKDGKLTGKVIDPVLDKQAKLACLREYAEKLNIDLSETLAIGDGSNDLPMLEAAGLGIGYRPKPLLREALDNCILYGDLSAALYAQGFSGVHF
jgi:phosphoserine phosphatase